MESEAESSLYQTPAFRMYCFKVLPCSKRFCHDWMACPFAHPGEKARRRDPRVFHYKGVACPEMKMGHLCPRGSHCPYAHNVFEYWLHPQRYRTLPCNDGDRCIRNVCFFAHTLEELRIVPSEESVEEEKDFSARKNVEKLIEEARRFPPQIQASMPPSGDGFSWIESYCISSNAASNLNAVANKSSSLLSLRSDIQNRDWSALESGYQWNGGPATFFIKKPEAFTNSLGTPIRKISLDESENLSHLFYVPNEVSNFL